MDVDRLSVYDCSASSGETADGSSITEPDVPYWDRPVMSDPPNDVTINAVDECIGCFAQSRGTFSNYIKHGLDIGWRAGNHAKYFTGRSLLLQCLLYLVEESDILNGDYCLVGKGLEKCDLLIGEGPDLGTPTMNHPNGNALS